MKQALLIALLGITVSVPALLCPVPAAAQEKNEKEIVLQQLGTKLKDFFKGACPNAALVVTNGHLEVQHKCQTFMIHTRWPTGELEAKPKEQFGPNYRGFLLKVGVDRKLPSEEEQFDNKQTIQRAYWSTYYAFIPIRATKNQFRYTIDFGGGVDTKVLDEIKVIIDKVAAEPEQTPK